MSNVFTNDGLIVPESYYNASPEEIDRICNGCGAAGSWLSIFIPEKFKGIDISLACSIHDWMYHHGKTWHDKLEADKIFLHNLLTIINKHNDRFIKVRVKKAITYFNFVFNFGESAYLVDKDGITSKENVKKIINKTKTDIEKSINIGQEDDEYL